MRKRLKLISSRLVSEETGQALILILCFVLLGSLTILPTLAHMSTALKTGVVYENKTNELFTADAGIENGIWRIKYDSMGPNYDVYDYNTVWSYQTDPVNNRQAAVTIQNVWIPTNATLSSLGITPAQAKTMVDSEKLVVTGTSGAVPGLPYHIKIDFTPATGDNLTVKSIGIWLPLGFTYTTQSSTLEAGGPFTDYYPDSVAVSTVPGGQAVVWSYNPTYPLFTSFPNFVSENGTMTTDITFTYTPPADNPQQMPAAIAWITTDAVANVPISWDTDTRIYKITSATGATEIESYSSKSQMRKLGDAIAGDYVAIGNSLMTGPNPELRSTLLSSSSTDVSELASPIPSDGDVIAAYLYWSGFRLATDLFSDTGSNFNSLGRDSYSLNQTRVPTADGDTNGTWNTAPCWDDVDETSENDTDFMIGTTDGGGYKLFTFSPFTIPAGSPIADLTVYVRAKDNSSGTNNIRPYIKVNGNRYYGSSINPGTNYGTNSYSFTTNPDTDAAWTVADINGTGANPLQQFGVYSSDLNPDIDVSMVYAEVNISCWSIYSSDHFQGQGSSNTTTPIRTLTLKNSINLNSYASGTTALYWEQDESGTLESSDTLYYALSSDGGATWSSNIEAFHDDNPTSTHYYIVPDGYMTSTFKMRFYFNFNDSAEYVTLDNIKVLSMPPDTSITFKINDQQVYLDASGDPQAGAQPLTASYSAILVAPSVGTTVPGYFFACYQDVSKLVKKYPVVPGEPHHTGNYDYTVGDVSADTGQYVSYAGWSLIIIYGSPMTAGHYLYLRDIHDIFASCPQYGDLDFDHDGTGGGDITGFVFPEPIKDKYGVVIDNVSARLTCFVCEGDSYTGDYLKITGQQSLNHRNLYDDPTNPEYNVWNSQSRDMSVQGVDVDTFVVYWTSTNNIFTPGDTRVTLDMYTGQDVWNLIYIIMSIRSETVTGGTENYVISGSP